MPITFHVKGTSKKPYRSAGLSESGEILGSAAVQASALPGAFGGSVINLVGNNGVSWFARRNLPSGALTMLIRFAPTTTGGANGSILNINNGYSDWRAGCRITQGAGDVLNLLFRNTNGDIVYNNTITSSAGYVADQFMDLWVVWDGTVGAGKIKLYLAQNGNAATLIASVNADYANSRNTAVSGTMMIGADPYVNGMAALLNEVVFWDEVIDPTTFGARTDFIPDTAFDGSVNVSAGAENIRLGTFSIIEGVTVTGTLEVPEVPDPDDVLASAGGNYVAPDPGIVDSRFSFGLGTQGTLSVPSPANTRKDIATGDGPGTLVVPLVGQVAKEVVFDNGSVGTLENVTNILSAATLKASPRSAVLKVDND